VPEIGFRRNIRFKWLEATAALYGMGADRQALRAALDERVRTHVADPTNVRQTVDILANIWGRERGPLAVQALALYAASAGRADHVALHYGMALLAYPFFRQAAEVVGQTLRFGGLVHTGILRERMLARIGSLGALADACKRVTFSLRDWGLLVEAGVRQRYQAPEPRLRPSPEVGCWLLAAALKAHPAAGLAAEDALNLPELYAFDVAGWDLRACALLEVTRQGGGYDMVRVREDVAI
jgi:hypothetical protein